MKGSEQEVGVREETSTITKKMTTSNLALNSATQTNKKRAKRIGTVFALMLFSSIAGLSLFTSSAHAWNGQGYSVYGPSGTSFCVPSGNAVFCS